MPDNIDILTSFVDTIKNDVIHSMQANNRVGTGDTIKELTEVAGDDYVALLAPWWIDAQEYGRKPTSPTGPYQISDPSFIDRLKAWCAAKGIVQGAAYAIKKKIDKEGYEGKPGVLTEPLGIDNINMRLDPICEQMADNEAQKVLDVFNNW